MALYIAGLYGFLSLACKALAFALSMLIFDSILARSIPGFCCEVLRLGEENSSDHFTIVFFREITML